MHYRTLPGPLEGAGEGLGATWGSGPPAPGVGSKTEGGADGRVGRGVTTSKPGRSLLTVDGAEGLGVWATASPSSSVVSMSPSAQAVAARPCAGDTASAGGRWLGLAGQAGSLAGWSSPQLAQCAGEAEQQFATGRRLPSLGHVGLGQRCSALRWCMAQIEQMG